MQSPRRGSAQNYSQQLSLPFPSSTGIGGRPRYKLCIKRPAPFASRNLADWILAWPNQNGPLHIRECLPTIETGISDAGETPNSVPPTVPPTEG